MLGARVTMLGCPVIVARAPQAPRFGEWFAPPHNFGSCRLCSLLLHIDYRLAPLPCRPSLLLAATPPVLWSSSPPGWQYRARGAVLPARPSVVAGRRHRRSPSAGSPSGYSD